MVQFPIYDLKKHPEGIRFDQTLDVKAELLERNPEILDLSPVSVVGQVRFEAGLFFLDYELSYDITMASSRSLNPVSWRESYPVLELFVETEGQLKDQDLVDEDLVLVLEGDYLVLDESVADNILLHLPSKVLTPEEAAGQAMPSGQDWALLTEEAFEQESQKKKEANSPFAQLQGLFDQE